MENGEIVGTSPGLKNNEFLVIDLLASDFELTLQVKLTPNAGNNGIQYRIVAVGDHIRTYINGNPCVDLHNPECSRRGIIAFQLHAGGPMQVRFQHLKLSLNHAEPDAD